VFVWCHPVLWNIIVCRPDRVCVYNRELAAATGCCVAKLFILIWAISHTHTHKSGSQHRFSRLSVMHTWQGSESAEFNFRVALVMSETRRLHLGQCFTHVPSFAHIIFK
jgi:hypothetical protein